MKSILVIFDGGKREENSKSERESESVSVTFINTKNFTDL